VQKRSSIIIRVCLLILAGGFAAQHSRVLLNSDHCKLLFVALILTFLVRSVRGIAFPILGFLLFTQAANGVIEARLEPRFAGDSMMTQVRVVDFPRVTGATVSMLVAAIDDDRIPVRTRVTWFDPPRLPEFGDIWELEVRLRRPRGNSNPGLFSLEDWAFREKLGAMGYVVSGPRNRLLEQDALSRLDAYRRDVVRREAETGGAALPVLAAISVGARHLLSRADWDRYAKTGTSHLMAISGLHIGLAAAAAFTVFVFLSGICRLAGNHLDQATLVALGTAAAYACISGLAVPSQRATIMLALAAVAMLSRRRPDPVRVVAVAAMMIFLADPVSTLTPGFNLSFAAVSLLLVCSAIYLRPLQGPACVCTPFVLAHQLVVLQLALLFGLMPLTILYFQRVTLLAPAANLLTVPVFSLVTVPLALAGMAVEPVSNAASAVLVRLSAASAGVIEGIITGLASLPVADTMVAGVDGCDSAMMCVILLPALWVVLPRAWPGRPIALLAVVVLLLYKPPPPPRDCIDAHILDVGQGLAVVVQSRRHTLVYDTGASYRDGGSAAEQLVLPFLRYRGIRAVDWLIVSHADDDHAGGVDALVRHIEIRRILAGEVLPDAGRDIMMCNAGQSWQADGVDYAIIHPPAGAGFTGNDTSCVLAVNVGHHQLLLTGDIEHAAEQDLLARKAASGAGVVLIPHHGSLTSSSPGFVNHLRPEIAIASVGYANRWGFPREPVLRRWEGAGARVLDTASSGAVSLRLCAAEGISRLRQERQQRRRFWHDSPEH
jgi:competence protein ComEC